MNQTWENTKKTSFDPILIHLAQIRVSKLFLKTCQSIDTMACYHHVKYQKKLIIQSWENLVTEERMDRQTERWTDEQTDKSDFIERSPTKVWNPKWNFWSKIIIVNMQKQNYQNMPKLAFRVPQIPFYGVFFKNQKVNADQISLPDFVCFHSYSVKRVSCFMLRNLKKLN